jgi:hypothetical protein
LSPSEIGTRSPVRSDSRQPSATTVASYPSQALGPVDVPAATWSTQSCSSVSYAHRNRASRYSFELHLSAG